MLKPKLSDFLLDLRRSLAHKGFAKILDISTGMPAVFANPYASRSQHISSQKIAQLRLHHCPVKCTDCFAGYFFICLFCLDFIVFIVVGYKYNLFLNNLPEKTMRKESRYELRPNYILPGDRIPDKEKMSGL